MSELGGNCSQVCVSTTGFYECQCTIGYCLSSDGFTCEGIQLLHIANMQHGLPTSLSTIFCTWKHIANSCSMGAKNLPDIYVGDRPKGWGCTCQVMLSAHVTLQWGDSVAPTKSPLGDDVCSVACMFQMWVLGMIHRWWLSGFSWYVCSCPLGTPLSQCISN